MQLRSLTAFAATALIAQAHQNIKDPDQIYTVTYSLFDGQTVTEFSGNMEVPRFSPGTHYLWPGVFVADVGGVLQPVLSSDADGHWKLNNTWYYGRADDKANEQNIQNYAFDVNEGDTINFNMQKDSVWTSTVSVPGTSKTASDSFPMIPSSKADHMQWAVFEIELWDGATWDFGPLKFSDIKIVASGTQDPSAWCNEKPWDGQAAFTITGVTPSVENGQTVCNIESMTLQHATS